MRDNHRVYRTIQQAILQLDPGEPKINTARMLTTLAALVRAIVLGKRCQIPTIARKASDRVKADSQIQPYSRWIQIHRVDCCDWSLFRLGLDLIDFLLNEALPIPVSFTLLETKSVR